MFNTLRLYLDSHRLALAGTLARLVKAPLASALTLSLIAVALALPAIALSVLHNTGALLPDHSSPARISVYLKPQTADAEVRRLGGEIAAIEGVAQVSVISAEESLRAFREQRDIGDMLALFDSNPLPAVVEVTPDAQHDRAPGLNLLSARLRNLAGVDRAETNIAWLQRLDAIIALARTAVHLLAALFAAVVLLVIAAIIRSETESRRDEMEILALLGAGDAFIRRPFFYTALCYGLGGGLLAGLAAAIATAIIDDHLRQLLSLYGSDFARDVAFWPRIVLYTTGAGAALCVAGAWLSLRRKRV